MCVYVSPDKQFNTAVVVQPQSLGLCTICNFKNVSVVLSRFYKHFSESVISTSHPMRKLHIFQWLFHWLHFCLPFVLDWCNLDTTKISRAVDAFHIAWDCLFSKYMDHASTVLSSLTVLPKSLANLFNNLSLKRGLWKGWHILGCSFQGKLGID